MIGAGKKTQTSYFNGTRPAFSNAAVTSICGRNLRKNQLGSVIFGCKNNTMKECLSKQIFGLPAQHFSYVKNIDPGLPLFLFNYSDRKLHGIFEAAGNGKMFIDPYGWTAGGLERTQYPAQVQVWVRLQCHPLPEDTFRQAIADNYYNTNHFWFELDHAQTSKLISLFTPSANIPGNSGPRNTLKWMTVSQPVPSHETQREGESFETFEWDVEQYTHSSLRSESTENDSTLDDNIQPLDTHLVAKEAKQDEKNLIFAKLQDLALKSKTQNVSLPDNVNDTPDANNMCLEEKGNLEIPGGLEKKEESPSPPLEYQHDIAQLVQEVKELTAFKKTQTERTSFLEQKLLVQEVKELTAFKKTQTERTSFLEQKQLVQEVKELTAFKKTQTERTSFLEQKLMEAELEIQHLKDRCRVLESASNIPLTHVEKTFTKSSAELNLDPKDSLFLIGGFDGESWLATMDLYSTSQNVVKSVKPMSSVRSYASVVQLNDNIYVFGGGNGYVWYDTVESYSPVDDNWTFCPSLNQKKGSLSGAALNDKIFAVGGGNGVDCFSDVEMLDLDIGRWITTRSMLEKRFALAAAELNGVLYATGGFDGTDYLNSAERFDPREHSWTKIPSMNTKRGCHSLIVLNEKLYAIGGFDGSAMVPSVEVFDPRLGSWMMREPMKHPRGYFAAAVIDESICVIGGVKVGDNIVDTVENYKEGQGWCETYKTIAAKRCFLSAIACGHN